MKNERSVALLKDNNVERMSGRMMIDLNALEFRSPRLWKPCHSFSLVLVQHHNLTRPAGCWTYHSGP